MQIGFSAADSVTSLKLIEQGVPKDKLAMLAIPIMPLQVRDLDAPDESDKRDSLTPNP